MCLIGFSAATIEDGRQCQLPFTYNGITYWNCTDLNNNDIPWCSLQRNHVAGVPWGNCRNVRCTGIGLTPTPNVPLTTTQPRRISCQGRHLWWRHQMETFSALLTLCAGNSSVTGEFPAQRQVTLWCFLYLCLNKWLSKESWGWWFETSWRSLWRHINSN